MNICVLIPRRLETAVFPARSEGLRFPTALNSNESRRLNESSLSRERPRWPNREDAAVRTYASAPLLSLALGRRQRRFPGGGEEMPASHVRLVSRAAIQKIGPLSFDRARLIIRRAGSSFYFSNQNNSLSLSLSTCLKGFVVRSPVGFSSAHPAPADGIELERAGQWHQLKRIRRGVSLLTWPL